MKRDLKYIAQILGEYELAHKIFTAKEVQYLETIKEPCRQQEEMYRTRTNSIEKRIVSIHQPFIRPVVRGKEGKKVEFGSKMNVSLMNGLTRINQFDFEPFNESVGLQDQVEAYKKLFGHYPELGGENGACHPLRRFYPPFFDARSGLKSA